MKKKKKVHRWEADKQKVKVMSFLTAAAAAAVVATRWRIHSKGNKWFIAIAVVVAAAVNQFPFTGAS